MKKADNQKVFPRVIRLFIEALLAIAVIETLVMLTVYVVIKPLHLSPLAEGFIDSFSLVVFIFPILYFLFYRPLSLETAGYKQALERVQELETSYQVIIQTTRDGFWLTDIRGRILDANEAYCRLSGYSRQELLTMTVADVEVQEKSEDVERHIQQIIGAGSDRFETRHRGKDGKIVDIEVSVNYLSADDGRFFAFLRDITERKQAEIMLEKFSTAVSQSADLVVITDKHGKIEYVNPAFERQTGYKIEEIIGRTQAILKSDRHDKSFYERLWKTILSGEVFRGVLVNKKKNGELYYSEKTITPIKDAQGNITNFVSTDRDITERKRYEEELIQANRELLKLDRLKSEFIANVSHELRTPIGILREGVAQVAEGLHGAVNAGQKRYLDKSLSHVDRLTRIVNSILELSALEAGKSEMRKEVVDMVSIAEEAIAIFTPVARNKGLELRSNFTREKIALPADREKIKQALINLIDNGIKFTERGFVEVKITDTEDRFECVVSDTGVGINKEDLPGALERFQQFHRPYGPGEKGVGLGLTITQAIIGLHGGKLWLESEFGKGTRVSFSLPKG